MEKGCFFIIPLVAGWLLDHAFGDPSHLPHPVVGFGRLIAMGEKRLNREPHRLLKGAVLTIVLVSATYVAMWGLLRFSAYFNLYMAIAIATVFVFYGLAGTTLVREVRDVFRACDRSTEEGRKQVARIVGRDTSRLSAQEVREAALETLAENLSDGVIAPLFWYALLGVPGMMTYKMINTLDSMIGYRNERYRFFGRFAARLDDAANYIPARITAALMIIACGKFSQFAFVTRYGKEHLSPNAGYPEAALAGILDCRFGGAHDYFGKRVEKPYIGANPRKLTTDDMLRSITIARRAEALAIAMTLAIGAICFVMA